MSRVYFADDLEQAPLPRFPDSTFDLAAMHALDAVCQDGLVRKGTAFVVVVRGAESRMGPPGVGVFTVPDKKREDTLCGVRAMLSHRCNDIQAVGFVELVHQSGQPYHSLHIENPKVCLHTTRCAFTDDKGRPISMGCPDIEHMSVFHAAPDGIAFWRRRKPARKTASADWHELIDKPKRKRKPKNEAKHKGG